MKNNLLNKLKVVGVRKHREKSEVKHRGLVMVVWYYLKKLIVCLLIIYLGVP